MKPLPVMLSVTKIRDLTLTAPPSPGRPAHVSAASGLVRVKSHLYVIADDELHLAVFPCVDTAPGHLVRLLDGTLPDDTKGRKKQKPDFECLTVLPPFADFQHGALLALGSGSRPNRYAGIVLALDADGRIAGHPRPVDLSPVFAPLAATFPELNIEGAMVSGAHMKLFQRGNRTHPDSIIVSFPRDGFLQVLLGQSRAPLTPTAQHVLALGLVNGTPLTFTDATPLPNGDAIFSAVAEATDDAYNDGACTGAALGKVRADGTLCWLHPLDQPLKIEGVDVEIVDDMLRLRLVTDADNPAIISGLYSVDVSAIDGRQKPGQAAL